MLPNVVIDSGSDRNGFRTSLTIPSPINLALAYAPDPLGRLQIIARAGSVVAEYEYDKMGRTTLLHYREGTDELGVTSYAYDLLGRMTGLTNTWGGGEVSRFAYDIYDDVGNYTAKRDYRDGGLITQQGYTFDDVYRLETVATGGNPDEQFGYDGVGNRTCYGEDGNACQSWTYERPNRLTSSVDATFTYDGNGNTATRTSGGATTTFVWSGEDKLRQLVDALGGVGSAKYDAFGRRVEKTWRNGASTEVRRYLYDGQSIVAELSGSGNVNATWVHGSRIDEPLVMKRGGVESQYFADLLGSVSELVDRSTGARQNRYKYTAFGETTLEPGATPVENPFAYTGREWENEWQPAVSGL